MSTVAVSKKGRGCRFDSTVNESLKEVKKYALRCADELGYLNIFPELRGRLTQPQNRKLII